MRPEDGRGAKVSTALLLVDVINDFFDPQGRNYKPEYDSVLVAIKTILRWARAARIPVVHAREAHRRGPDFEQKKLPVHCLSGSWDVQPPAGLDVGCEQGSTGAGNRDGEDLVVYKRRYSAFFGTDLDLALRERQIARLVVVGVKTHVCVRATVQDAFAYGYEVVVPREATGSNYHHLRDASLEDIQRYMGQVVSLDETRKILGVEG
ncbi:MAG: cysteine hydrolase [Firmicutes bacterium]|nr:cysteine hydrolase [Bacillota bacterium]